MSHALSPKGFERTAYTLAILLATILLPCTSAQSQRSYSAFKTTVDGLRRAASPEELDRRWHDLVSRRAIPVVEHDSVAFFYRGEARKVVWMGDFNGWGNNPAFQNEGKRIPGTDLWILKASLPEDARLDYKILVDDNRWILDPANPFDQWSGVGGGSLNSELRMPGWGMDSLTVQPLPQAPRGSLRKDILFDSRVLGYQLTYSLYIPPAYEQGGDFPILYVTDGYEYMHERMGNLIAILDNLIFLGRIKPVVAVFIDHRDPVNRSVNRRMQELAMGDPYQEFIVKEFIPAVESGLNVLKNPSQRAIIGNSLGGLSAMWLSFSRPDVFGLAGVQSPAFWFRPGIYKLCEEAEATPQRLFLTTGRIHDAEDGVLKMQEILNRKGCAFEVKTVNQGHSWGNWRDLADDMISYLFSP